MKEDKILEEAKKKYQEAEDAWNLNREAGIEDIRFARLGEQWPDDIRLSRESDGLPCLTINRLPAYIRQVVNDARLNTPQIKVRPVDGKSDPETAEIINGIIRNIESVSSADTAYDKALEDAVTNGFGYFRIDIDYADNDAFELDLRINRISNPMSITPDPNSTATDARDWNCCFVEENIDKDTFKATYPNASTSDWDGKENNSWVTQETVKVAEYWKREEIDIIVLLLSDGTVINQDKYIQNQQLFDASGLTITQQRETKSHKVTQYLMTSAEILETTEWPGTFIPICPVYGDEVVEQERRWFISLVRPAIDSQRNFNYWRTQATTRVALATKAPWIGPVGAFDSNVRDWESANTETHPFLEYDGPVAPTQTMPSMADVGSITEALSASDDMKQIIGLQDASMGIASNETSGKAINARKQSGDISTFHFKDNLSRGMEYAGKVLLELIPFVYDKPRVMRVMGFDGETEQVTINEKYMKGEGDQAIEKLHDLTVGKYDLVVKTGPAFATQREESAYQMTELIRAFPDSIPIIGDLVALAQDWPGSEEIAKRLKTLHPPEIQAMEKMDGLPPEAQSAIASAQQQVSQLSQVIQQGKQMLTEKDEQIKGLEVEKKSKQNEIAAKDLDSQRKYEADMAKIEADKEITAYKETEENRRIIIGEATVFLREYIDKTSQTQNDNIQTQSTAHEQSMAEMMQGFEVFNKVLTEITQKIDAMNNKTIEIQAPSGGVYEGVVENGNIEITAPSGAKYTGNVTQH